MLKHNEMSAKDMLSCLRKANITGQIDGDTLTLVQGEHVLRVYLRPNEFPTDYGVVAYISDLFHAKVSSNLPNPTFRLFEPA